MNIISGNRVGCARIVYMLTFWGVALALAVAVLFLASCSSGTPAATHPAAVMAAATQTEQLTATDEPTPWPTADLRYLEQQRAEAELAAKIANNKQLEADAEQKKADAQSTTIANLAIVNTMESDKAKATAIAAAMLTPTAAAVATQQRQGVINVQKQDDERINNAAIAYRQNIIAWGWNILGLIGIPTGCIVLVLGVKKIIDTPAPEIDPNKANQTTEEYLQEKVDIQTSQGQNQVFNNPLQITRLELVWLHNCAVEYGGVLSRRKLMTFGFTQARADELKELLKQPGPDGVPFADAGKNDTTVLNNAGWALVKASPTSPRYDEPPESCENAGKS